MNKISLLFLLLFLRTFTHAQEYHVVNYTSYDGLSSIQVYDIIEDKYGYMWFSTDNGLCRYNGAEFETYNEEDGLIDRDVFDFYPLEDEIWCTTNSSGIFKFNGITPEFTPYPYNSIIKKHSETPPYSMHLDKEGNLKLSFHFRLNYLAINSSGQVEQTPRIIKHWPDQRKKISVLKEKNTISFFHTNRAQHTSKENVESLIVEKTWGKSEGIYFDKSATSVFINKDKLIIKYNDNTLKTISFKEHIIALEKWDKNHFWIGRKGGGSIYSLDGVEKQQFLPEEFVSQLYKDRKGNIWVSTLTNGVYKFEKKWIHFVKSIEQENKWINDLAIDSNHELFAAYYNGNISKVTSSSIKQFWSSKFNVPIFLFSFPKSIKLNQVNPYIIKVSKESNSTLYSSHYRAIANFNDSLIFRKDRHLALYRKGQFVKNLSTGIFRQQSIQQFNNQLYLGGKSGLHRIKQSQETPLTTYETPLVQANITGLFTIGNKLVITTKGDGILLMNKQEKIINRLTKKQGLISNYISNLFAENDSTWWLGTDKGVNKIILSGNDILQTYEVTIADGLISNNISDLIIKEDTLWIGTRNGLNYFTLHDFEKNVSKAPSYKLHIVNTSVNEKIQDDIHQILLNENEDNLSFSYQAINLSSSVETQYRYQLIGIDSTWQYTTKKKARFSNIVPGAYQFVVQAKEKNHPWEANQASIHFTVVTHFWKSTWFNLIVMTTLLLGSYYFIKKEVKNKIGDYLIEVIRQLIKRLKGNKNTITIQYDGASVVLNTADIGFVKAAGNYIEIKTEQKTYLTRMTMSEFLKLVKDPLEFTQLHRSYIIRKDKIEARRFNKAVIVFGEEVPVSRSNVKKLEAIYAIG